MKETTDTTTSRRIIRAKRPPTSPEGTTPSSSSTTKTNKPNMKVFYKWNLPDGGVRERDGTQDEMRRLFDTLPSELSVHMHKMFPPERLMQLNEIYLQLGQFPECIFAEENGAKSRHRILDKRCTTAEIDIFAAFFQDKIRNDNHHRRFSSKRKGIPGTIHRVSLLTDPSSEPEQVLGITVRVGRAMEGLLQTMVNGNNFFAPLVEKRQSLLLIGRPGVGKSTALREIACLLSQNPQLIVVVVDKSKELAGCV